MKKIFILLISFSFFGCGVSTDEYYKQLLETQQYKKTCDSLLKQLTIEKNKEHYAKSGLYFVKISDSYSTEATWRVFDEVIGGFQKDITLNPGTSFSPGEKLYLVSIKD